MLDDEAKQPVRTVHHLKHVLHPSFSSIKAAMREVDGLNAKVAVFITSLVGTMWCAYLFTVISLVGLPAALRPNGEGIVAWIAQTFLQLVLLSVIMVGQNVQSATADARSIKTYEDSEVIKDYLNLDTAGGMEVVLKKMEEIKALIEKTTPSDNTTSTI
ncbi:MAG: hypothetical protein M1374_08040 [Firmicutes bacterium]|jgi:hypothetical protein|nr:hypothetical protein [Bacillota bacterium]